MNNSLSNMSGLRLGATPQEQQRYAMQQFQNQLAAQQQGVQNQIQQQQQQQQQHPPVDLSWQSNFPKEMREQQIRTLYDISLTLSLGGRFANLFFLERRSLRSSSRTMPTS